MRLEASTPPGRHRLGLRAVFADGETKALHNGTIEVEASPPLPAADIEFRPQDIGRRVVVCMATYEPEEARFRRQIESLKAQTLTSWHCIVNDDGSSEQSLTRCREIIGDRFTIRV